MTNFYSIKTKLLYEFLFLDGTSCPLAVHELQDPSDQSEECLLTRSQCRLLMLGGAVRACPIVAVVQRRRRLGFNNQQSHAVLLWQLPRSRWQTAVLMGGNSPSHFSTEDWEGGGVTFVKGIRVSGSPAGRGSVHVNTWRFGARCGVGCRFDLRGAPS